MADPAPDTDAPRSGAAPSPGASRRTLFRREEVEFSRATAYFDATFALATTLLVTTLDPSEEGWASWSSLYEELHGSLLAFGISFAVVASFWWLNHCFVADLKSLSGPVVWGTVAALAFVVLIPFTTQGLSADGSEVATVVYAANVAVISLIMSGLFVLARREGLYTTPMSAAQFRIRFIAGLDTPFVFLLSIPVALVLGSDAGRITWALLIPASILSSRYERRARP